jgi:hypothetical protein
MRKIVLAAQAAALVVVCGCGVHSPSIRVQNEPSPVKDTSLVPQMTPLSGGRILLSWQRPLKTGGYAFELAVRHENYWSEVRTIASGPNLSMFSADLPGVAVLPGEKLLAYWELKDTRDGDPYATAIQTAISADEGKTWGAAAQPYGETFAGQHSFLSWFPASDGLGLLWLDADERSRVRHASMREVGSRNNEVMGSMGSVGLRYAALNAEGQVTRDLFVDPITCECCPTSASVASSGPVVVYRGRQDPPGTKPSEVMNDRPTVRDIYITRLQEGRWTKPHLVHADNWVINACPDNGPAVDASGNAVAVAWWTGANDAPKVQVAFSFDAGDTFGRAIHVDSAKAEGQVTLALLPGGDAAIIGWLENGQTWARWVSARGVTGPPVALGRSPRHSRLPKWVVQGDNVLATWTSKQDEATQVMISRLNFSSVRTGE